MGQVVFYAFIPLTYTEKKKKKPGKGVRDIQFYVRCTLSKDILQNFQDRIWISDKHRGHHDNSTAHKKCYIFHIEF